MRPAIDGERLVGLTWVKDAAGRSFETWPTRR
jgi:hypothetical protein